MCALGGQDEGEGRKPVRKGLSAKLERKVTEDKQQTKNHQNACQNTDSQALPGTHEVGRRLDSGMKICY